MSLNPRPHQANKIQLDDFGNPTTINAPDLGVPSNALTAPPPPPLTTPQDSTNEPTSESQSNQNTESSTQASEQEQTQDNIAQEQDLETNEKKFYKNTYLSANKLQAQRQVSSDGEILDFLANQKSNIDFTLARAQARELQPNLSDKELNKFIVDDLLSALQENPKNFSFEVEIPKEQYIKHIKDADISDIDSAIQDTGKYNANGDFWNLDTLKSSIREVGFIGDIAGAFGLQSERDGDLDKNTIAHIASGKNYDELPQEIKNHIFSNMGLRDYARAGELTQGVIKDITLGKDFFGALNGEELAKKQYENMQKAHELYKKDFKDLSGEEIEFLRKTRGDFLDDFFNWGSDRDFFENSKRDYIAKSVITNDVKKALVVLDNIADYKQILANKDDEAKKRYTDSVEKIAQVAGFDAIKYDEDKQEVFFIKDDRAYKVNDGFFENFGAFMLSNAGAIAGGIQGATAGFKKNGVKGSIIGAALGSALGGSIDYAVGNYYLDRENNFSEMLRHATQEGVLSLVGDVAALGVAKGAKKIVANTKGFKESLGNIIDYTPVLGFAKRAVDGNARAVENLISQTYTKAEQQALKDFSQDFGAYLTIGAKQQDAGQNIIAKKFGEEHKFTQAANKIQEALSLNNQSRKQEAFIRAIRADESGNLLAFITEVANQSPQVQQNLKSILNQTTARLSHQLENLGLAKNEIKEVFNTYEKGTKDSYNNAIEGVIKKVYDESYKVQIAPTRLQDIESTLTQRGILADSSAPFLQFIKNNIYNEKGVSFDNLNNALKTLNAYYKEIKDPNFKTYIDSHLKDIIKQDIKQGIDSIFAQNPILAKDAQTLFSTALADYSNMKAVIKSIDKLKVRDARTSYKKSFDTMLKYLQGQGNEISNFKALTKDLDKEAQKRFEIGILNELFTQSLTKHSDLKVFNSNLFF